MDKEMLKVTKIPVELTVEQMRTLVAVGAEHVMNSMRLANDLARKGKPVEAEVMRAESRIAAVGVDVLAMAIRKAEGEEVVTSGSRRPI